MDTIRLQGVGLVEAIKVRDLKVGDTTVWNFGALEDIVSLEPSKTGKTFKVGVEYADSRGEIKYGERKLGAERFVGIKR